MSRAGSSLDAGAVGYAAGVAFKKQLARCQAARQEAQGGIAAELGRRRASSVERACRGVSQRQRRRVVWRALEGWRRERRPANRSGLQTSQARRGAGEGDAWIWPSAASGRGRVRGDTDEAAGAGQAGGREEQVSVQVPAARPSDAAAVSRARCSQP